MKLKLALVILSMGVLSGCATMGGAGGSSTTDSITQLPDQPKLISAFNTAKDGVPKEWAEEDASYQLVVTNTHVNYQGVPCRDFSLVVTKSFYRTQTLLGTACRYKNQWKDSKTEQLAYGGE